MEQIFSQKIISCLKRAKKKGATVRDLLHFCSVPPKKKRAFASSLAALKQKHAIIEWNGRYYDSAVFPGREAVITQIKGTFGFAKFTDDQTEVFIPGKFFQGALPGDKVLVTPIPPRGEKPEGAVVRIIEQNNTPFTGTLLHAENGWTVQPDNMSRLIVPLSAAPENAAAGDKVLCEIDHRGASHMEHTAKMIESFGDAQTAVHCAEAMLAQNGIPSAFPEEVEKEANALCQKGLIPTDYEGRLDLRDKVIFTIDGADSKDLDDAVSLDVTNQGYRLGVHIADVSHYVTPGSALDQEAFSRGTSIYFADRVIPMLPKALSNGICSLNPKEDRLAFSCLMEISKEGKLLDFSFHKSVIRSAVKGVYDEVNAILSHTETDDIKQKYDGLYESIFAMQALSQILLKVRQKRGALELESTESHILLDENHKAIDIVPRKQGDAEKMIEDFMLLANESAATLAKRSALPFVYRVHEPPAADRLENLKLVLDALGVNSSKIKPNLTPTVLAELLSSTKDKPFYAIINQNVLRSMSKAKYLPQGIGHYGLALENYAHFTSPIRRYPDLSIHRILTDFLLKTPISKLQKRYGDFVVKSSLQSSETELKAMRMEFDCDACYLAEYMKAHLGETFDAVISGVISHGFFVALPNTVEGMVRVESLPEGNYEYDGLFSLKDTLSGKSYRIGDAVSVKCVGTDVSVGKIDFELAK